MLPFVRPSQRATINNMTASSTASLQPKVWEKQHGVRQRRQNTLTHKNMLIFYIPYGIPTRVKNISKLIRA